MLGSLFAFPNQTEAQEKKAEIGVLVGGSVSEERPALTASAQLELQTQRPWTLSLSGSGLINPTMSGAILGIKFGYTPTDWIKPLLYVVQRSTTGVPEDLVTIAVGPSYRYWFNGTMPDRTGIAGSTSLSIKPSKRTIGQIELSYFPYTSEVMFILQAGLRF